MTLYLRTGYVKTVKTKQKLAPPFVKTFELSSSGRSAITSWKRKETSSKIEEDKQFLLASKKKKKKKKKKDESNSASQISALETPKMSSATAGQQTLGSCINISECCESRSYLDNED